MNWTDSGGRDLADFAFSYAPAKIILGGEHAVVYGETALALAIDQGIRLGVTRSAQLDGPVLRSVGWSILGEVRPGPNGAGPKVLREALAKLVELMGSGVRELLFTVDTHLPFGCGLGSSAALSVALIRSIHRFWQLDLPPAKEQGLAFELERIFHGNPSGVDHTVISSGGMICYRKTHESSFIERVNPKQQLKFAVGLAGAHVGTSRAVTLLKERVRRHPDVYGGIFSSIGHVAREMKHCVEQEKLAGLGELMDVNQGFLNALGLSTPKIEALCSIARERGALGAKLTGAGCGGAVIALVDSDPQMIVDAFMAAGYSAFAVASENIL